MVSPADRAGKRSRSHRRLVKRIIKRKVLANEKTGEVVEYGNGRQLSPGYERKTQYEVITQRIERDGSTSLSRVQKFLDRKPNEFRDLKNSMKMLEHIKRDVENQYFPLPPTKQTLRNVQFKLNRNTSDSGNSVTSGLGLLSSFLNPKNVTSMQTIELSKSNSHVYIQTLKKAENPYDAAAKRKKITIIKRRRNKDGSVESTKQSIFKDYEDNLPQREAVRLKSALQCYRSSVQLVDHGKTLDGRAPRDIMQLMPDGTLVVKGSSVHSPFPGRNKAAKPQTSGYSAKSLQRVRSQDMGILKPAGHHRSRDQSKHTSKGSKAVTNQSFKTEKGEIDENFEFEPRANPSVMFTSAG
jgi:hypothetical protein